MQFCLFVWLIAISCWIFLPQNYYFYKVLLFKQASTSDRLTSNRHYLLTCWLGEKLIQCLLTSTFFWLRASSYWFFIHLCIVMLNSVLLPIGFCVTYWIGTLFRFFVLENKLYQKSWKFLQLTLLTWECNE